MDMVTGPRLTDMDMERDTVAMATAPDMVTDLRVMVTVMERATVTALRVTVMEPATATTEPVMATRITLTGTAIRITPTGMAVSRVFIAIRTNCSGYSIPNNNSNGVSASSTFLHLPSFQRCFLARLPGAGISIRNQFWSLAS